MDASLDAFRAFVLVAELEHLTLAAKRLGISPSALSRRLQQLEHTIGIAFFDRQGQRISLNAAGRRFLPEAKKVVCVANHAVALGRSLRDGERDFVRLGMTVSMASSLMPDFLTYFVEQHSHIRLYVEEGTSEQLEDLLMASALDFALMLQKPRYAGIVARYLWEEPTRVVAASQRFSHLEKDAVLRVEDILDLPLVVPIPPSALSALRVAFSSHGREPRLFALVDNFRFLEKVVSRDLAVGVVPEVATTDFGPALCCYPLVDLPHSSSVCLTRLAQEKPTPAQTLVCNALVDWFAEHYPRAGLKAL